MDYQETCPQCAGTLSNQTSRLVQDACGHKKCRLCLLNDENSCKQCSLGTTPISSTNPTHAQIDCHTAVITYQRKSEIELDVKPINPLKANDANINRIKQEKVDKPDIDVQNEQDLHLPQVPEEIQPTELDRVEKCNKITKINEKCLDQSKKFPKHISFDSVTRLYTCSFCNKSFSLKSKVKYHKYCNGEKRPHICDICNQGFITKSHYTTHQLTHQKSKPYKCPAAGCGKTFSERSKLNRHGSTHGTNRPFICQNCGKSFKNKENLRTHCLIHKNEKPYGCDECDLRFSHSSNLKKHLAVHTSDKTHMCDQCGKRYKLKWALTLHRRVHAKTRPNKCSTCHKSFVHLKDLARHELIHAESKGFRCGVCGATFRRKDNLNRHARNTHPGKKPQIIKCVDTPNAIKVITAPPVVPTLALEPPITKTEVAAIQNIAQKPAVRDVDQVQENEISAVKLMQNQPNPVHVPVKLAFKALTFRRDYKINNDFMEQKSENVSIYEKILKPRSEIQRTSTITQNIPQETTKEPESHFEQQILIPFNAPSHYETSFDNKKHAVIKNIKFKLPDKYTNLNTAKKPTSDGNIATTSVIVNSTGNQQQQTV